MTDGYKVVQFDKTTVCYGELSECSNFEVVCENEDDDNIWLLGNPNGRPFIDWDDVVRALQPYFDSDILEITAV